MVNIKKYCIIILCLFVQIKQVFGQKRNYKEVHIGEQVPDMVIAGFLNDGDKKVKLSTLYDHKLLILDFWATWCGSCIAEIPKLDSIKKNFSRQVEILSVGYEKHGTVNSFFKNNLQAKPKYFPVITDEHILTYQLFPHRALPHMVWIDSTGKVIAITVPEDVTDKNIHALLKGNNITVRAKIDNIRFDFTKPFHLRDSSYIGRSLFTTRTNGIASYESYGFGDHITAHMINRIFMSNQTIRQLYQMAAFRQQICRNNFGNIILEVKDSLRYMQPKFAPKTFANSLYKNNESLDDWAKDNLYCYDLQMPKVYRDTVLYKYMLTDLNRYLNLRGRFEYREHECYSLQLIAPDKLSTIEVTVKPEIIYNGHFPVSLKAQPISMLVEILNTYIDNYQVVNEITLKQTLKYNFNLPDIKSGVTASQINTMINKYGLALVKSKRVVRVFVISED